MLYNDPYPIRVFIMSKHLPTPFHLLLFRCFDLRSKHLTLQSRKPMQPGANFDRLAVRVNSQIRWPALPNRWSRVTPIWAGALLMYFDRTAAMRYAKLSVAMCAYNGELFLREQLDSIAAQPRLPNELVVFEELFLHLSETGIYLCEDMDRSYNPSFRGGYPSPGSFTEYATGLVVQLNAWHCRKPDCFAVEDFAVRLPRSTSIRPSC
jgi:hypothetical protein